MTNKRTGRALNAHDYRRLAGFRHGLRQFLAFSEAAAAQAGLTSAQHQALLAVKGMPGPRPVSVGELAAWLGIRHHSCVGLVERLVKLKLLMKRADPADQRRVTLSLTRRAESKLAALSLAHRAELARLSQALSQFH